MKLAQLGWIIVCSLAIYPWLNSTARADDLAPAPVLLWPDGAPQAIGTADEDKPAIYPFPVSGQANTGASILVCPGGGFTTRCIDYEGVEIARWLNAHGIGAFVLRYRIQPLYRNNISTMDSQRAIQFLRAHAEEYHINPAHIGIMGFSAGSELACMMAFRPLAGDATAADPLDHFNSRPDFIVLAYGSSALPGAGAARGGGRGGRGARGGAPAAATNPSAPNPTVAPIPAPNVAAAAVPPPPTFMYCTAEDSGHLNGMVTLYSNLLAARVNTEVHFFQNGEHGTGLAQGDPVLGQWPTLMYNWIRTNGFLSDLPRVPMHGIVTLDGKPLSRGYVIFTPIDAVGAPPLMADVFNSSGFTIPDGGFIVKANQGPTPGKYRLEVHLDAGNWMSNSKNPVMLDYQAKQRAGTLTDADQKAYEDWAHNRNLEPTIENQRVYSHVHPADKDDLIAEVKPGGDNEINISVFSK